MKEKLFTSEVALRQLLKTPGGRQDLLKFRKQLEAQRRELVEAAERADIILERIGAALGEMKA